MWWIALGAVVLVAIPASLLIPLLARRAPAHQAREAERLVDAAAREADPVRRLALLTSAGERVERVLAQTPPSDRHRDGALILGFVRFEQERYADAIEWLQEGLRRPLKRDLRRRGHEWLALAAAEIGDHDLAHSTLAALVKQRQPDAQAKRSALLAARLRAVLAAKRGDATSADDELAQLEKLARTALQRIDVRETRAIVGHFRGEALLASTMIESVIESRIRLNDPAAPAAITLARSYCYQAEIRLRADDGAGALAAVRKGLDHTPHDRPAQRDRLELVAARVERGDLDAIEAAARERSDRVLAALVAAERVRRGEPGASPERAAQALISAGEVVEARWLMASPLVLDREP